MSIAIQTSMITGNGSATFTFPSTVGAYAYALQQFNLQTLQPGTVIQRIGLALRPRDGTGVGTTSLIIDQQMLLDQVDLDGSWAEVAVVAWLGSTNPPGLFLQNQNGITVDQMSSGTSTPPVSTGSPPMYATAAIAGFSYQFAEDNSDFLGIGAGVGATPDPYASTPSMSVVGSGIWTGDSAFTGVVDAALIATTGDDLGLGLGYLPNPVWGTNVVDRLPGLGGAPVGAAAFLIQSFFCQFCINAIGHKTPDFSQVTTGVPSNVVQLNVPSDGNVSFRSVQQLCGCAIVDEGPVIFSAENLVANYLVAETASS
ncbi:hypothetical protein ACQEUX_11125 [Micromonospora sp. CA-259024]|uniref:hypothetical protein n=1 Tax=Micromonospora sp. CA-259024 TaxID=3239965 RepID=UPI003D8E63FB